MEGKMKDITGTTKIETSRRLEASILLGAIGEVY